MILVVMVQKISDFQNQFNGSYFFRSNRWVSSGRKHHESTKLIPRVQMDLPKSIQDSSTDVNSIKSSGIIPLRNAFS